MSVHFCASFKKKHKDIHPVKWLKRLESARCCCISEGWEPRGVIPNPIHWKMPLLSHTSWDTREDEDLMQMKMSWRWRYHTSCDATSRLGGCRTKSISNRPAPYSCTQSLRFASLNLLSRKSPDFEVQMFVREAIVLSFLLEFLRQSIEYSWPIVKCALFVKTEKNNNIITSAPLLNITFGASFPERFQALIVQASLPWLI